MATEIVTRPDFDAQTVRLLTREKAVVELARHGFSREQAKRLVFWGWKNKRQNLEWEV